MVAGFQPYTISVWNNGAIFRRFYEFYSRPGSEPGVKFHGWNMVVASAAVAVAVAFAVAGARGPWQW